MFDKRKVTLITFAGRRDRMSLLIRFVDEAIRLGIVDEWQVWDFTRTVEDRKWLHENFPALRRTGDDFTYRLAQTFNLAETGTIEIGFNVRASNDAHIGIRSTSGDGMSSEIVLGGWGNLRSGIRVMPAGKLGDHGARSEADDELVCERQTPGILNRTTNRRVDLVISNRLVRVYVDKAPLLDAEVDLGQGQFDLLVKSGWGTDAEWLLDCNLTEKKLLFVGGGKLNPNYNDFYEYHSVRQRMSPDDVVIKCDDDIVFIDLAKLEDFIRFRVLNPQYFLVSANVVNNGVCAYYQQVAGAIPTSLMALDLPPNGWCGTLWESSELACISHSTPLIAAHSF